MIKLDSELNKSEEIANFLLFMLEEERVSVPRLSIKQILFAKTRPGLNSDILTSSIVSRFSEAGIPSGANAGGPLVALGSTVAPHTGIGVAR